jgi:DNA helicase-2/ATP-dependent DNA helicase PcrA
LKNDVTLLKHYQQKYRHILIDEFQDINCVQFEIVKLLMTSNHTLFVVGDDDQSIYRFRGSKPEFLLELEKYYETMETVVLDQNYRSTKNILNYSNVVITQNQIRYPKLMHTQNEQGTMPQIIVVEDLNEQAQKILGDLVTIKKNGGHFSECAVIYRTNIEVRSILNVLLAANIPFQLKDAVATLLDQWITKDIEAYFQLAKNPNQVIYLERIINRPNRYIGRAALQEAKGRSEDVLSYLLQSESLMSQQKERLDELRFHLQKLAKLPFAEGVKFIRQQIGYDTYLQDYANYRKMPVSGMIEIADEIEDSTKEFADFVSWYENLYNLAKSVKEQAKQKDRNVGVTLTTMHSAKGLEFKYVWIIDLVEGVIPHSKSNTSVQVEEERRLFYVALTRAQKELKLLVPKVRYGKAVQQSAFLVDVMLKEQNFQLNQKIRHKTYGLGVIKRIEGTKGTVTFKNGERKIMDLAVCLKKHLIKLEEN